MPPPLYTILPSFTGGEFSPALHARVDIQKYITGLKTARNVNVMAHGGIRNRPGTMMVSAAGNSSQPVRLISFIASSTVSYILEFGHLYIRFYTAGGFQVVSGGVPYQITSPYVGSDLAKLKFTQSNNVLYIAHASYAPRQLTNIAATNWTLVAYPFANGPYQLQNTDSTSTITATPQTWATATDYIIGDCVLNSGTQYVCAINHTSGTFATDLANGDWISMQGPSSPVITPISGRNITLTATKEIFNSNQVGGLFQINYLIPAQNRLTNVNTNNFQGVPVICGSTYNIITAGTWTGTIIIQVSIDNGVTWKNIQSFYSSGSSNFTMSGQTGYSQCLIRVISPNIISFPENPSWTGTANVSLTCLAFTWIGNASVTSFTSTTQITVSMPISAVSANSIGTNTATFFWSEGSWSTYRGWPVCVTFYQDRLCWASTTTEIQTIWMTKVASYADFGVNVPLVASDGFSIIIPSRQLNTIYSLIPMPQALVALTADSEWSIQPGTNGVLSATSVQVGIQGYRGSAFIDPIIVGIEIILIQRMGTVVRNLIFQLAVNGFQGDNISIVSQHLFTGFQIVSFAYQHEPDSIIWAVRSDGQMLSCTYMREQEVSAWTRHDTNGLYESVAVIPNTTLNISEVWVVVNRGGTRFIEVMKQRDQGTAPSSQWFLDCALQYSGTAATIISGLSHLNGYAVGILADGNVITNGINDTKPVVVANGQITLAVAASTVLIGLPFISDIGTLRLESPDQRGTIQGRKVVIPRVSIRFWNSRGGWITQMSDDLVPIADSQVKTPTFDEIPQREPGDNMNAAIALKTRDYLMDLPGGYDNGAQIFFRQIDPLPFTILGLIPQIVAGEN